MNDADYEIWAALMEEEAPKAPATPATTPVVTEQQKFFPLVPVNQEVIFEPQVEIQPVEEPALQFAEFVPSVEDLDDEEEPEFPTNLFREPQTNSIMFQEIPDALNSEIITDSGEILKTGAIDLPLLNNTGSIPIITVTPDLVDEEAIKADMGWETTGGIPPIRAGSVMNSSARVGVLPIKNRRSEGQTILLVTTSILMVTLGALLLAAYMLKIIN